MKKIKGIIFDMDGLLFDTEKIYYESTQKIADQMGFSYDKACYLRYLGVSDEEVQAGYHREFACFGQKTVEEFIQRTYQDIQRVYEAGEVPLKSGVLTLLDFLEEKNIPKMIASSNVRPVIDLLLGHAGILERFMGIVSAEDVKRAKPDPEIFQVAHAILGASKEQTLIFEDSFHGVTAAYEANLPVIMIPDLLEPTLEIRQKTVGVFGSLEEIPEVLSLKY